MIIMKSAKKSILGNTTVEVSIDGVLNCCTAPHFQKEILYLMHIYDRLTIDFSNLSYFDSKGMNTILAIKEHSKNSRCKIEFQNIPKKFSKYILNDKSISTLSKLAKVAVATGVSV